MCRPAGACGGENCFPGVSTPGYFIQPLRGLGDGIERFLVLFGISEWLLLLEKYILCLSSLCGQEGGFQE
jgi:hypothetical protein